MSESYEAGYRFTAEHIDHMATIEGGVDLYVEQRRADVYQTARDLSFARGRLYAALNYQARRAAGAVSGPDLMEMRAGMTLPTRDDAGPWVHVTDGSTCDVFRTPHPRPSDTKGGCADGEPDLWWCTEHQSHLRSAREDAESWTAAIAEADRVAAVRAARRAAGDPNEIARWAADQDANDPRRVDPTAASDVHAGAICGVQRPWDAPDGTPAVCQEPAGHATGGCEDDREMPICGNPITITYPGYGTVPELCTEPPGHNKGGCQE